MTSHPRTGPTLALKWLAILELVILTGVPEARGKDTKDAIPPSPSQFYAISYTFWDNGPAWDYHIIDVKQQGSDTVVRDILVISERTYCGATCRVKAKTKTLRNTTPDALVSDNNPCAVDQKELRREIQRSKRARKHMLVFSSAHFGIVADCGGKEVVLHLPMVPFGTVPQRSPQIARSYELLREVEIRVFGTDEVFKSSGETSILPGLEGDNPSSSDDLLGESLLSELRSGSFDRALCDNWKNGACADDWLQSDLKSYIPLSARPQPTVMLIEPNDHDFVVFRPPGYPPLAKMAGIEGKVVIELQVDSVTGSVSDVKVITGHPLLQTAALEAARKWQLRPTGSTGSTRIVRAVLEFERNCPGTPSTAPK